MKQLKNLYSDARTRLLPGDVRRNYFLVGAMWNSPFFNAPANSPLRTNIDNHIAGTARLSNSTMETYNQATSPDISNNAQAGLNCFSCHDRGGYNDGNFEVAAPKVKRLSHVFGAEIAP